MLYKNEIDTLVKKAKKQGLRIFVSETGSYGFITNSLGTQVIAFGIDKMLGMVYFSTRHKPSSRYGTGFRISEHANIDNVNLKDIMNTGARIEERAGLQMVTCAEHLKAYECCKYKEV